MNDDFNELVDEMAGEIMKGLIAGNFRSAVFQALFVAANLKREDRDNETKELRYQIRVLEELHRQDQEAINDLVQEHNQLVDKNADLIVQNAKMRETLEEIAGRTQFCSDDAKTIAETTLNGLEDERTQTSP